MPNRYTGKYIVRWQDEKGNKNEKTYDSWALAQKAARWLADNKAVNIDIAVHVVSKQTENS